MTGLVPEHLQPEKVKQNSMRLEYIGGFLVQ